MWTDTAQVYNLHIFASRGGGDQPVHQEISAKHWDMMDFSPFFCIEKWNSLKKVFVGLVDVARYKAEFGKKSNFLTVFGRIIGISGILEYFKNLMKKIIFSNGAVCMLKLSRIPGI